MIDALRLKPDLDRSLQRFEAWWVGEVIDRPPVTVRVQPRQPAAIPARTHATLRDRWLDAEFQVEAALARLRAEPHLGDKLPMWMPNVGPELLATLFGCDLEFGADTSWSLPNVHELADWAPIASREPDFGNVYWQTIERMTDLALDAFAGEALVGIADLHGNYDTLAALRDPQMLCLDLMDDPAAPHAVLPAAVRGYVQGFERLYAKLAAAGQPSTTWTPMLHAGPAYVPSCDFWCMLGPDHARELVLPGIVAEMAPLRRSVFHLDGPQALPHLDLLLQLPQLDAVQWVYGAGHGPARNWLDVYRRCRAAGKSIHVLAEDGADALAVLEALGPAGVWLDIQEPVADAPAAEALLREIGRASASRAR